MSPTKRPRRPREDARRHADEGGRSDASARRKKEPRASQSLFDPARRLAIAASITIVGLGLVGIGESDAGAIAVLVGLLSFAFAIHTYGRLGIERPDP